MFDTNKILMQLTKKQHSLLSLRLRAELNLAFVMGIVGLAVGLVIAMFIFGAVDNGINCADIVNSTGEDNCNDTKNNAWIVLGILPITLFFVLFRIFGGSFG